MTSMRLVAVVTGGAAGIGLAIASPLARDGYDIAVADIDAAGAERAVAMCGDVRDRAAAFRMVDAASRVLAWVSTRAVKRRFVLASASSAWGIVGAPQYRDGKEGNRVAEALGTMAHRGWVRKSTGRNASEARASLESDVVKADPL